ncbi:MAG: hypothetical protein TU36_008055, partial [Vulcanisaeta sp. AZ3]
HLSYAEILNINVVNDYTSYLAFFIILTIIGGFLAFHYGPTLMRPMVKEIISYYSTHGIFDIFMLNSTRLLLISLLIPSIVTYLMSTEIIKVPGYNYIPYMMMNIKTSTIEEIMNALGFINLTLNTWLVVGTAYLQLKIASKSIMRKLGGAVGVMSTLASTGTATVAGAACTLGTCAVSGTGATPIAVIIAYLLGQGVVSIASISQILMPALLITVLILLLIIHHTLMRS